MAPVANMSGVLCVGAARAVDLIGADLDEFLRM